MLAPERFFAAAFPFPHLLANLERFLEALKPLLHRGEGDAEPAALRLVPGGAEPEPGSPAREDIEGGDGLRQDARLVVNDPRHHGAELGVLGHRGDVAERAVAFEHLVVFGAVHADLPEVIHHPDGVEAGLVRGARNVAQRAPELGRSGWPGEISDIESDLHAGCLLMIFASYDAAK